MLFKVEKCSNATTTNNYDQPSVQSNLELTSDFQESAKFSSANLNKPGTG